MHRLTDPPRDHLTEDQVLDALMMRHGLKTRFGLDVLDSLDNITEDRLKIDAGAGGEIQWAYRVPDRVTGAAGDAAQVRRTASLSVVDIGSVNLNTRRFRPWIDFLTVGEQWARWYLGVYVPTIPPIQDDGVRLRSNLELAEKTWRYANRFLEEPEVVEEGTDIIAHIKSDLETRFNEGSFNFPSGGILSDEDIVLDQGMSYLEKYNMLLESIGYDQLHTDSIGRPTVNAKSTLVGGTPEWEYGPNTPLKTEGTLEALLPTLPNVVRFVARQGPSLPEEGNGIRTKRNQSLGDASIDARGGEEVVLVVETDAQDQVALDEVANADAQRYFAGGGLRYKGKVGINPSFEDRELIWFEKPRLGITRSPWFITSWRLPLRTIRSEEDMLMDIELEQRVEVT